MPMLAARQRRLTVTQANALALSSQEMSLIEKRLVLVGVARLNPNDPELRVKIFINEYNDIFNTTTNANHERLSAGAKLLLSRVVHVEQEDGEWEMFQWVNHAHYMPGSKSKEGAFIEMEFNHNLSPYLVQLTRNFNSYTLEKIARMQSFYSVRIFEILHHDSFGGRSRRLEYDLDDLKLRLHILFQEKGKTVDRYPNFKDFRVRVLEKAQRDCEAFTDMSFVFEGKRRGRRIATVVFEIKSKVQSLPVAKEEEQVDSQEVRLLTEELRNAGYVGDATELIETYGLEYVHATLKLARKVERDAAMTPKPIRNLGGLVAHLIKSGAAQQQTDAIEGTSNVPLDRVKLEKLANMLRETFLLSRTEQCNLIWGELTEDERHSFHDIMRIELSKFLLDQLDKSGWQGAGYEAARNAVLFDQQSNAFPEYVKNVGAFVEREGFFNEYSREVCEQIVEQTKAIL